MSARPVRKGGKGTGDPTQLLHFLREINRGSTLAEVGEAMLRFAMVQVPQAEAASLLVFREFFGQYEYVAAVGWDLEKLKSVAIPKEKLVQRRVNRDQPAIIKDILALDRAIGGVELAEKLAELGPVAATLTLPLWAGGTLVGCLNLDHHTDPEAFREEDLAKLSAYQDIFAGLVNLAREREELRESETLFRLLFERLADAVYITAFDGTILEANPAAERQTGYSRNELLGMNIMRDIAAGEPAVTYETVNEQLRRGETVVFEEKKRRKDGTFYWTECAVTRIEYKGRLATLSVNRDITARVEAAEALARRDRLLSAVAFAAERFLRVGGFAERVAAALARLGEAAGVSRVYIFENRTDGQGRILTSQRYEWVAPGIAPQIGNPELQDLPYVEAGFSRWVELLSRGEVVHGLVRDFPQTERPLLEAQGIVSLAVVPIFAAGAWWGFIGFDDCAVGKRWSAGEVAALRAAAQAIGAAIERTRIEEELRAHQAELEGLYEVSVALGTTLDLEALFGQVHAEVTRLIPCDAFTLALVDARRGEFHLEFAVEEGARLPKLVRPLAPGTSLTAWIVSVKEPLLIRDVEAERDRLPAAVQRVGKEVASWLGVPLLVGDDVLGVISVQSFRPRAYDEGHLRLLSTVAGPVATAIRNAQVYAAQAKLEGKLRAVEQASQRMKLAEDKGTLYATVLELADEVLGYRACAVLERHGDALVLVAERGYAGRAKGFSLPLSGPSISVEAFSSGEPIYVPDVSRDARYVPGAPDTRSELAIPLRLGARAFGVFDVQHHEVGIPSEDQDLLKIVAAELSVALAGLERLATIKRDRDRLAALHRAVQRLEQCSTVDGVCQAAVEEASGILGFTICTVGLVEGDLLVPRASSEGARSVARPFPHGEGLAWKTLETGQTRWGNLEAFPEARPVRSDFRSILCVPIGDFGVFQVAHSEPDAFSGEDARLVEVLAGHLAEQIRRIRLEAELREQAIRDPLTGLYNRRYLTEVLEREIERAKRYSHPLTLLMGDIDGFKRINDRYGHVVGDRVLREVAAVLQKSVRAADYVFRYGGEEFVVLLVETGDGAEEAIARLREAVATIRVRGAEGLRVGLSMGHTVWNPAQGEPVTIEDLLHRADEVLYAMKRERDEARRLP